jgi:transposase
MAKKYIVKLTVEERQELETLIASGKGRARKLTHARILLKTDAGEGGPGWTDNRIVEALDVSVTMVERVRERYVEAGLEGALNPRPPQREYPRKIDGEVEAKLIAVACSEAPAGRKVWTLQLLADKLVELELVDSISAEGVRKVLKKTSSSRG